MASRRRKPYRILLPLANPRTARDLVRIGAGIGQGKLTEITALGIVEVPEGVSLSEGATHARTARRLLQRVLDFGDEEEVEIRTMVRIGRRAVRACVAPSESETPSGTSTMPRAVISVGRPWPMPAPIRTRSRAVRGLASGRRIRYGWRRRVAISRPSRCASRAIASRDRA